MAEELQFHLRQDIVTMTDPQVAVDSALDDRLRAVVKLTELFKLERIVHLIVTCMSLVVLIFTAIILVIKSHADATVLTLLFGSSGLITYSTSRLLRMWDQALEVLGAKSLAKGS
jgi:predicted membrane channel-forming protein YqfA (hemolysin III family)